MGDNIGRISGHRPQRPGGSEPSGKKENIEGKKKFGKGRGVKFNPAKSLTKMLKKAKAYLSSKKAYYSKEARLERAREKNKEKAAALYDIVFGGETLPSDEEIDRLHLAQLQKEKNLHERNARQLSGKAGGSAFVQMPRPKNAPGVAMPSPLQKKEQIIPPKPKRPVTPPKAGRPSLERTETKYGKLVSDEQMALLSELDALIDGLRKDAADYMPKISNQYGKLPKTNADANKGQYGSIPKRPEE